MRCTGIRKAFPGVVANDDASLVVNTGEVHALLGENGAGKSTLSNILTGLYRPDAGQIELFGETCAFHSPADAIDAGVGMVHQHFRLVDSFTVAENLALGRHGSYRPADAIRRAAELSERHGLPVDPAARISDLTVGQQQRVEILKALDRDARVLILDEPTAVLTPQESSSLFVTMRAMADAGRAVIFISHKLHEVREVSDQVTVLRGGRTVANVVTAETGVGELAELMVGREIVLESTSSVGAVIDGPASAESPTPDPADVDATAALSVDGVRAYGARGELALAGVSLSIAPRELVALCGVAGNGQRMLADVIAGVVGPAEGRVAVDGDEFSLGDPRRATQAGIAYIPEDRLRMGLVPSMTIEENLALKSYRHPEMSAGPFLRSGALRARAVELIERFDVRAPGPQTPTRLLSGGNVQKVLLARELSADPRVIVAASPTRGLDVGAIEGVRATLSAAADDGAAVLLITEDLDEAFALSTRLLVMYDGRIVGDLVTAEATRSEVGLLMGGGRSPS